jgi:hypothetical protein
MGAGVAPAHPAERTGMKHRLGNVVTALAFAGWREAS